MTPAPRRPARTAARRPHRRAAALLLTVGVLALAVVSLSITARRSMAEALRARAAADDLQRRLIVASIERGVLPYAAEILEVAERDAGAAGSVAWSADLGDVAVRCRLADEQAKLNLNAFADRHERWVVEEAVRSLTASMPDRPTVRLRPHRAPAPEESALPAYGSFDQVFEHAAPEALLPSGSDEVAGIDRLTLWGDGRVNALRADPEVLVLACRGLLSEVEVRRLIRARSERTGDEQDLTALLQQAGIGAGGAQGEESPLAERLTMESSCFSAWITLATDQRRHDVLLVREAPPEPERETSGETQAPVFYRLEWE